MGGALVVLIRCLLGVHVRTGKLTLFYVVRFCYTDDLFQVTPRCAMVVFIPRGQDLTIDGCQGKRWVVQIELIVVADVAHCSRLGRGYVNNGSVSRPDTPRGGCEHRQDRVGTGNVSVFGALLRCLKNRVDGGGLVRDA
jgi:hypothetical protein